MMTHIKITKLRLLSIVAPLVLITTAKAQTQNITEYETMNFTPKWQDEAMKTHSLSDIYFGKSPLMPKRWRERGFDVIRNAEDFKRVFEKEPPEGVDFNAKIYVLMRLGVYYNLQCLRGCQRIRVLKTENGKNTLSISYTTSRISESLFSTASGCLSAPANGTMQHSYQWETLAIPYNSQQYNEVKVNFVRAEKQFFDRTKVPITIMNFTPQWLDEFRKKHSDLAIDSAIDSAAEASLMPDYWRQQGFDVIRNAEDFTRVFGKAPEGVDFNSKIYVLVRIPIYGSCGYTYPTCKLFKCDSTRVSKTEDGKYILEIKYVTACWSESLRMVQSPCTSPSPILDTKAKYRWETIALPYNNPYNNQPYDDVKVTFGKIAL